jgi:integrase
MRKRSLTQLFCEQIRPPKSGYVEYPDTVLTGFRLVVSHTGRKSWVMRTWVAGKVRKLTIGSMDKIPSVADARRRALEAKAEVGRAVELAAVPTFAAVAERFVTEHAERNCRASTVAEYRRILAREVLPHWGERPIAGIGKPDVVSLLDRKATRSPKQSDEIRKHLRAIFNWSLGKDLIAVDPCSGIRRAAEHKARDRTLTEAEIRLLWAECDKLGYPFGQLTQLLLVSAQRRGEVAGASRDEIDLEKRIWTIPASRSKNGKAHAVHLSDLALRIIETLPQNGLLFTTNARSPVSGFSKIKLRLDAALNLAPWTLHDLRRTATTGMAKLGTLPHVADRVLNHQAGTISGVAAIYNRFQYLDERREALDLWGQHLERLVDNVVEIPRRA